MTTSPLLEKLAAAASMDWDTVLANYPGLLAAESDPVRTADGIATMFGTISGYLDARRAGFGHDAALDRAGNRGRAIRKALGYTNP